MSASKPTPNKPCEGERNTPERTDDGSSRGIQEHQPPAALTVLIWGELEAFWRSELD
jgi:hypothetical protein